MKDDLINAMVNRDMIKIVLVGQYSAGKSSIIKMLTGEDDIRIAADIATDKATSYQWKGVEITDTPGIDTRLRPEHDEISKRAIQEADMLLFVITNELFDENIAKDFKELAFTQNRKNAMLLVVNKMERANDGNSPEQQEIIKQDVARVTAPCTPDDFHIGFIEKKAGTMLLLSSWTISRMRKGWLLNWRARCINARACCKNWMTAMRMS